MSWNLGFAGLGREAEFAFDGGSRVLPASRAQVRGYLAAILETIRAADGDVLLLQEVTRGGLLSRGVDLFAAIAAALPGHSGSFHPDTRIMGAMGRRLFPHGMALFHREAEGRVVWHGLPGPGSRLGLARKVHGLHELHFERGGTPWVVAGVHLDPYSPSEARKWAGVQAVLDRALALHSGGRHVLVGGDWNLLLQELGRPCEVPAKRLAWAVRFPHDLVPPGWRMVSPAGVPTNRTLERPLAPGRNYLSAIDGFLVSPGCVLATAETLDLGFAASDHNPVVVTLA